MRSFLFVLFCFSMCLIGGCGGSSTSADNGVVTNVSINPNPIYLKPTQGIQLTAILDGGSAPIVWDVNSANGGTITSGGVYTAPEASGTYEVQVALTSDPSKFGKANAIVDSNYIVSVFTSSSSVGPFSVPKNGTLQMLAKVEGASSDSVIWSTTLGSISPDGVLTAPNTTGTAMVTAVCSSDRGKSATVAVDFVP